MKRVQLNLQIDETLMEFLDLFCLVTDTSKSEATRQAIEIVAKFDSNIWNKIKALAENVDYPLWALVQNFVIAKLVEYEEFPREFDLSVFIKTAGKPYTGEELAENYRQNLKARKAQAQTELKRIPKSDINYREKYKQAKATGNEAGAAKILEDWQKTLQ